MADVKPIPDGYASITPYLVVDGAADAIAFYTKVFGASERMRLDAPEGRIGHAELVIGSSVIMLADANPAWGARGPQAFGGSPVSIHLYVADVDAVAAKAVAAGAKIIRPVANQFYGDRSGGFEDPFGHQWHIATHIEDVPPAELAQRAAAAMSATPPAPEPKA